MIDEEYLIMSSRQQTVYSLAQVPWAGVGFKITGQDTHGA